LVDIIMPILTFSLHMTYNIKCETCGPAESAQSLNVPELCSIFDLMMAHSS